MILQIMGDTGLRHRKRKSTKIYDKGSSSKKRVDEDGDGVAEEEEPGVLVVRLLNLSLGLIIMVYMSYQYCVYCNTLHENQMYFTNIKVSSCRIKSVYIYLSLLKVR